MGGNSLHPPFCFGGRRPARVYSAIMMFDDGRPPGEKVVRVLVVDMIEGDDEIGDGDYGSSAIDGAEAIYFQVAKRDGRNVRQRELAQLLFHRFVHAKDPEVVGLGMPL